VGVDDMLLTWSAGAAAGQEDSGEGAAPGGAGLTLLNRGLLSTHFLAHPERGCRAEQRCERPLALVQHGRSAWACGAARPGGSA